MHEIVALLVLSYAARLQQLNGNPFGGQPTRKGNLADDSESSRPWNPKALRHFAVDQLYLGCAFVVLQLLNRRAFREDFPFVLFTFMSLHALFIVLLLTPALRRLRSERNLRALKLGHWAGLVLSAFLTCAYVDVVIDQLPCFLGVPNCD